MKNIFSFLSITNKIYSEDNLIFSSGVLEEVKNLLISAIGSISSVAIYIFFMVAGVIISIYLIYNLFQ